MRFTGLLAAAAAVVAMGLTSPDLARAFDRDRPDVPAGWSHDRVVRHWVYYPRYRHYYYTNGQTDPFAYDYVPGGYYPYYNSHEWKPAKAVPHRRAHFVRPHYYPGWGKNKANWDQAAWHAEHHGRHAPWDW